MATVAEVAVASKQGNQIQLIASCTTSVEVPRRGEVKP
jgi:hypothetical protein